MTRRLCRIVAVAGLSFPVLAAPAAAQATRDEWLALRTRKQARHHQLPAPATQPGALTITAIRFFSDPSGLLVGVGEARNDTNFDLSYSRINFRFLDSAGLELGREWTYLHGGVNARILPHHSYETLLLPGATGFFKVWTTIPAAAMSSYTAESAGENLAYTTPRADLAFGAGVRPELWRPIVFLTGYRKTPIDQRVSLGVINSDPLNPFSPSGLPHVFTYTLQASVAAYQDGIITDVQSVTVAGRRTGDPCRGEPPVTGIGLHESVAFTLDFARPVNGIGRHSLEWQEVNLSPTSFEFSMWGGEGSFTVARECGWTAVSSVPWIRIVEGAAGARNEGRVTFTVDSNPTSRSRGGEIYVSGEPVSVIQGHQCDLVISPIYLGSGRVFEMKVVPAPYVCLIGAASDAAWLTVKTRPWSDGLWLTADPNFTNTTRSAVVTVGNTSFTVYQNGANRNADFNGDGRMDLLWHHRADGRVAVWKMNGLQPIAGIPLSWQMSDPNWTPVAAADLDGSGTTDVLWQNVATGAVAFWRLSGTDVLWSHSISSLGPDWEVRGVADFNRDGDPDFVWQHEVTGEIVVWYMRAGTFFPPRGENSSGPTRLSGEPLGPGYVTDLNWKIVGTGDFNGDGWPDLVWQHQGDGRIAVWKMRGAALLEGGAIARVQDLNWKVRAVGDINGDDKPDLIWRHLTDGRVATWLMDGTTVGAGIVIARVADPNWQIVGPR